MNTRAIVMTASGLLAAATMTLAFAGRPQAPPVSPEGWRSIVGTWSATGTRQTLATEGRRPAAILQLSGAIVLQAADGLSRGFRGEFIGFDDGDTVAVGRFLWTDEHGNEVFGRVEGEPVETGRRFVATITGGTGRYAGITGDFAFTWQSIVEAEGTIQGRTSSLTGRYKLGGGTR